MKHTFIFLPLVVITFLVVLPVGLEEAKAEDLDGKQVLVRIYQNWQKDWGEEETFEEDIFEFELVYTELEDSSITLDYGDINDSALVVVTADDQEDEEVNRFLSNRIYAWLYEQGPLFELNPRQKNFCYLSLSDALDKPLSQANIDIFLYPKDLGKNFRFPVRRIKTERKDRYMIHYTEGDIVRIYVAISSPDNNGIFEIVPNSKSFSSDKNIPWVSKDSKAYEQSVRGIVVDANDEPISGASVESRYLYKDGVGPLHSLDNKSYKVLTDPNGRFSLYVPLERDKNKSVRLIPPKSDYHLRIEAPEESTLSPYVGHLLNDGTEHKIKMAEKMNFHTFVFMDKSGVIEDPERLKKVALYSRKIGDYLEYRKWKDGGYFPNGQYEARVSKGDIDLKFEPIAVTDDSPEELIFKPCGGRLYYGKVVHGITGKPIYGAFVIASNYSNIMNFGDSLAKITPQQWDKMRELSVINNVGRTSFETLSGYNFVFEKITRTDPQGRFEMWFEAGYPLSSVVAFEEDFLGVEFRVDYTEPDSADRVKVGPIPLFPAAIVVLKPFYANKGPMVKPLWIIDETNLPDWAGKPYTAEPYDNVQLSEETFDTYPNSGLILLTMLYDSFVKDTFFFYGIPIRIHRNYNQVWEDNLVEMEPKEDPNRVLTFYEISKGSFQSFVYDAAVPSNQVQTFHIPAGLNIRVKWYNPYDYKLKWASYVTPKTINLKQGETLNLGSGELKIAPKVFVKVIDTADKPVKNAPVEHWFEDAGRLLTECTDENGMVSFYTRYNSKGEFVVGSKEDGPGLYEAISYEMGGEEDKGSEFTIVVSDEVLHHILK